ncbi:MAG TPA: polysaccharide deacetylase family protein [Caulobacteraceae bacterium]|jgi:peptidoglycan/xylan/chitin deacetylase (PgdA/CDA1 family)|nr:polysaccharide deacetylase family protein [Caulobacteraceae bacterium]
MTRGRLVALIGVGVGLLVVGVAAGGLWLKEANAFYRFDGVTGPPGRSAIASAAPARIADFDHGGPHRLAVLVTDPASDWLGLARGFKAEGIPFTLTQDPQRALQHKVMLVYPMISGRLAPDILQGIAAHVRAGGTVLGFDLEGGGVEPVFGIKGEVPSQGRETLRWPASNGPPEEQTTRIGRAGGEGAIGSLAYQVTDAKVLAQYEDGGAAIVCRAEGGTACLMGADLGELARRAIDGRDEGAAREYVNQYEPSLDVLVRWVKDLYVAGEPMPWLLDTAPTGHDVSIVLTHDIDYTRSVVNSRAYAELERSAGVKATYFMQTKYIRDYNDDVFLTKQTVPMVRALQDDEGMEVASHTVAHSRVFKSFPLGDGREHYPDYRPFVETATTAHGGTVFGETRVSKFLLERLAGIHVTSFRPGHLSYPFQLPEALQATGYQWSSSVTADSCLTHLPHRTTISRAGSALSPIYEFPVTIEDEEKPRLGDRFEAESAVIAKIAAHHGLVVILIHPDIRDHKFAFEQQLIQRWKDRAWMPDLDEFGRWWRARDEADLDVVQAGGGWSLDVNAPEALQNLTVMLPKSSQGQLRLNGVTGHSIVPFK